MIELEATMELTELPTEHVALPSIPRAQRRSSILEEVGDKSCNAAFIVDSDSETNFQNADSVAAYS